MRLSFMHRLDLWARNLLPFLLTLLMLIAGTLPLPIPHFLSLGSGLALISVYYWGLHRPGLLPAPAVFVLGLLGDLLGVAPLGVGTLMLLLVYAVALSQRRVLVGQPFLVVWWGFMVIAAGSMAVGWVFSSLLAGAALDLNPVIFSYLITLALYPAVADLFARAQRAFLRAI